MSHQMPHAYHPPFHGSDIRTASPRRRYGLVGIGSSTVVLYVDSLEPPYSAFVWAQGWPPRSTGNKFFFPQKIRPVFRYRVHGALALLALNYIITYLVPRTKPGTEWSTCCLHCAWWTAALKGPG